MHWQGDYSLNSEIHCSMEGQNNTEEMEQVSIYRYEDNRTQLLETSTK